MARVPFAESRVGVAKQEVGIRTERAPVADYSGLEQLGRAISSTAQNVGAVFQQEARKKKEADIMAAETPFSEAVSKADTTFRLLKGTQVTPEALQAHEAELSRLVSFYGDTLEGDAQKVFLQHASRRTSALRVNADAHVQESILEVQEQTRATAEEAAVSRHAADPLSLLGIEDFKMAVAAAGSRRGDTPERREQAQRRAADRAAGGALNTLLQNDNPDVVSARAYLGQVRNSMTPDAAERADEAIAKAERVVANDAAAVAVIKSVQEIEPGRDPESLTKQEALALKANDDDLLQRKITLDDHDARSQRISRTIGGAKTDLVHAQQAAISEALKVIQGAGSDNSRRKALATFPEYVQKALRPVVDNAAAASNGKKVWESDPGEINKRVSFIGQLLDLGKIDNEQVALVYAQRMNLPPEEQERVSKMFNAKRAEIIPGLGRGVVHAAMKGIMGVKDVPYDDVTGMWRAVTDSWPKGKPFDTETLSTVMRANLMEMRYKNGTAPAYKVIAEGGEATMVPEDRKVLLTRRVEMNQRATEALTAAGRLPAGPGRSAALAAAKALYPPEDTSFEAVKRDILARDLGLVPGETRAFTQDREANILTAQINSVASSVSAIQLARAQLILQVDEAQVDGAFGIEALRKKADADLAAGRFPKFAWDYIEASGRMPDLLSDLRAANEGKGPDLRRKWIDFTLQEIK